MRSAKVHDAYVVRERSKSKKRKARNNQGRMFRIRNLLWRYSGEPLWRHIFRRIIKTIVRWFTGKSEIHRICLKSEESKAISTLNVATCLLQSRQLGRLPSIIFSNKAFNAASMVDQILYKKRITFPDPVIRVNLRDALESINTVNAVIERLAALRKESFDRLNPDHEALLESFWEAMRPGVRREHGRITTEWGEVGFQGKDPATDFRGMGILALHHLVHFAQRRSSDARNVLTISSHPVKYYPFAATGVNITSFVCELLEKRLLDVRLYKLATPALTQSSENFTSCDEFKTNEDTIEIDAVSKQRMLDCIGDMYGDLYVEFNEFWESSNPTNTLDFPRIYNLFKDQVQKRLQREWQGNEPLKFLTDAETD